MFSLSLSLYIYIYIYIYILRERERELGYGTLQSKTSFYSMVLYFNFKNPNIRSELFNMFFILKCAWRPNFTFFYFFYYLLSQFENHRSDGPEIFSVFYCSQWICNFQSYLINSKKNSKKYKI